MSARTYGPEEQAKLKKIIDEGATVLSEVEDLSAGLKDTVKAVAEELEIKPALINKAIKIAHKGEWSKYSEAFDCLENLIIAVGGGSVMDLAKCANTLYYIENLKSNKKIRFAKFCKDSSYFIFQIFYR